MDVKYCVDCKHCETVREVHACFISKSTRDLVTGLWGHATCCSERYWLGDCGREAKNFSLKETS